VGDHIAPHTPLFNRIEGLRKGGEGRGWKRGRRGKEDRKGEERGIISHIGDIITWQPCNSPTFCTNSSHYTGKLQK